MELQCPNLLAHKCARQKFIMVDAVLSVLALIYIFMFSQTNIWFSFAVLLMVVSFNGYAQYSYRQLEIKHAELELEATWAKKWFKTRFFICFFEWSLYFTYLLLIGPSVHLYQWILFAIGVLFVGMAYYELEKLEHYVGIYSLVVDTNLKTSNILVNTGAQL